METSSAERHIQQPRNRPTCAKRGEHSSRHAAPPRFPHHARAVPRNRPTAKRTTQTAAKKDTKNVPRPTVATCPTGAEVEVVDDIRRRGARRLWRKRRRQTQQPLRKTSTQRSIFVHATHAQSVVGAALILVTPAAPAPSHLSLPSPLVDASRRLTAHAAPLRCPPPRTAAMAARGSPSLWAQLLLSAWARCCFRSLADPRPQAHPPRLAVRVRRRARSLPTATFAALPLRCATCSRR